MRWLRRVRKASIGPDLRDALEQAGRATVQMLAFYAPINRTDLPAVLSRISDPSTKERAGAFAWLTEVADKAERKEQRIEIVEWAILIFVIFGVIVDALLFCQERHWLP
jgi:hypothetical protein